MAEPKLVKRRPKRAPHAIAELTPYQILEVPETANFQEIRKAYLAKVRLSPPEQDPEGFTTVQKAYATLKNAARRKALDLSTFRTELSAGPVVEETVDGAALFRDRVFRILLASSDLYLKDFSRFFATMDEEIRSLS
jgi:curved DNA-binding protein CbpA